MTFLAGQIPTAFELNTAALTYVPTLTATTTNPTLGTGSTARGSYMRWGMWVIGEAAIRFGSSGVNAGSGSYVLTLPPIAPDDVFHRVGGGLGISSPIGHVICRDNSSLGSSVNGTAYFQNATSVVMVNANGGNVNSVTPFAWDASDGIIFNFTYLAAAI